MTWEEDTAFRLQRRGWVPAQRERLSAPGGLYTAWKNPFNGKIYSIDDAFHMMTCGTEDQDAVERRNVEAERKRRLDRQQEEADRLRPGTVSGRGCPIGGGNDPWFNGTRGRR